MPVTARCDRSIPSRLAESLSHRDSCGSTGGPTAPLSMVQVTDDAFAQPKAGKLHGKPLFCHLMSCSQDACLKPSCFVSSRSSSVTSSISEGLGVSVILGICSSCLGG